MHRWLERERRCRMHEWPEMENRHRIHRWSERERKHRMHRWAAKCKGGVINIFYLIIKNEIICECRKCHHWQELLSSVTSNVELITVQLTLVQWKYVCTVLLISSSLSCQIIIKRKHNKYSLCQTLKQSNFQKKVVDMVMWSSVHSS